MKPVLVLQMQRMGDLILTFPLLLDIQRRYPGAPLWVVAQPAFFKDLLPFSPQATYFPPTHLPSLEGVEYSAIFNLGSDQATARFVGNAAAEQKYGPILAGEEYKINGFWHLYRASLTRNNRHNTFHWADLLRMDLPGAGASPSTQALASPNSGKIGLFIGASEASKRPETSFWIDLATRLKRQGIMPLLLGGPAEAREGSAIARACNLNEVNFCGKTSLASLAALLKTVDLLVTPDTGPMHLANWLGTRTLNLSMGNVSAFETGPTNPGQLVLRARMSCYGCWQCMRGKAWCRQKFGAPAVARVVRQIVSHEKPEDIFIAEGLSLMETGRESGLISLEEIHPATHDSRQILDSFWRGAFREFGGFGAPSPYLARLVEQAPQLAQNLRAHLGRMLAAIARIARNSSPLPDDFWQRQPWQARLFAGFLQMEMQNDNFSKKSIGLALERIGHLEKGIAEHLT